MPHRQAKSDSNPAVNRRRMPRRQIDVGVGVLVHGEYLIGRTHQVGEGGAMLSVSQDLVLGQGVVVNFFLNREVCVIVRSVVRSIIPAKASLPKRYGVEFVTLGFQQKREIRNFVAAATYAESLTMDN